MAKMKVFKNISLKLIFQLLISLNAAPPASPQIVSPDLVKISSLLLRQEIKLLEEVYARTSECVRLYDRESPINLADNSKLEKILGHFATTRLNPENTLLLNLNTDDVTTSPPPIQSSESHEWKKRIKKFTMSCTTLLFLSEHLKNHGDLLLKQLDFKINSKFYPMTKSNEDLYIFSTSLRIHSKLNTIFSQQSELKKIEDSVKSLGYSRSMIFVTMSSDEDRSILLLKTIALPGKEIPYKMVVRMSQQYGNLDFRSFCSAILPEMTLMDLQGRPLKISAMTAVPSRVSVKSCQNSVAGGLNPGSKCYELERGMVTYVLWELEKRLNFTSVPFPGGGSGGTGNLINGTWSGIMGDIVNGEGDIGFCAGENWLRHQYAINSGMLEVMVLTFITGKQPAVYVWKAVFWPLSKIVWIFCGLSFIFGYFTVSWMMPRDSSLQVHLNAFDFIVGSFLEKSCKICSQMSLKLKLFMSFWALAGLTIATVYRGNLVGLLAFPLFPSAPKNWEELSKSDYKWALRFYGGLAFDLIKRSMNPTMITIAKSLELEPDPRKCFQRTLDSKYVCITYGAMAEFEIIKNFTDQFGRTDLRIAQSREYFVPVGPVMKHRSYLYTTFKWAINQIFETGLSDHWIKYDFDNVRKADLKLGGVSLVTTREDDGNKILTMKNFKGALVIFCAGILSSFLMFLGESCQRLWVKIRNVRFNKNESENSQEINMEKWPNNYPGLDRGHGERKKFKPL